MYNIQIENEWKKFKENEQFALYCATNVTQSRNGGLFGVHALISLQYSHQSTGLCLNDY